MTSPAAATEVTWISSLPLPSAPADARLRVEFALANGGNAPVGLPFLGVGETGRFARVLLARLADADGRTQRLLACKLQRDVYRGISNAAAQRLDNPTVEAIWARERRHLELLAGRGAPGQFSVAPGAPPLPPIAFDPERKVLFTVRAPGSFAALEVCRDDETLIAAGLEPWSRSLLRYLHCPTDRGTFYFWAAAEGQVGAAAPPRGGVRLLCGTDLYFELRRSWAALDDAARRTLAAEWPDGAAAMAALASPEDARRLVPLCFHPAHALLLELQDLHYDELVDLLGGADLEQVAAAAHRSGAPGRGLAFARLTSRLGGDGQWWSAPWTPAPALAEPGALEPPRARRLAVEAALLKVAAFAQVCRALREYHGCIQQPHLGLSPDNVMFRIAGTTPAELAPPAPARWCFTATLVDLGSSLRLNLSGLTAANALPELFRPSPNSVRTFVSPLAAQGQAAAELPVQVTARALPDGDGLLLELNATQDRFAGAQPGDLVRLLTDGPLPGLAAGQSALLGLVVEVGDHDRRLTVEVRLEAGQYRRPGEQPLAFAATATWHRRLQAPCDLFALGMLLARALLCHDQRDVFAVRELWDRIIDKFELDVADRPADGRQARTVVDFLLDAERAHLGSESVLFPAALRQATLDPLPPALWREALVLMARLLTNCRGFSFAAHHGDAGSGPTELIDRVIAATEELQAQLHDELDDAARNAGIGAAAAALQTELASAMVDRAGGEP